MKRVLLSQGKHAIVDDADFDRVNRWKWSAMKCGRRWYAIRHEGRKAILMHRLIAATLPGLDTDHLNGDGLDNRRRNLRACTRAQNLANQTRMSLGNTSGARGVTRKKNGWQAQVRRNNKNVYLGLFPTVKAASAARKAFERHEHEQGKRTA